MVKSEDFEASDSNVGARLKTINLICKIETFELGAANLPFAAF